MIGKTTVLVICIHKRVKSIVFTLSIKFCDESGLLKIPKYMYIKPPEHLLFLTFL